MKIKVKRYKEIEEIALIEAVKKTIKESATIDQLGRIMDLAAQSGLKEETLKAIQAALAYEAKISKVPLPTTTNVQQSAQARQISQAGVTK